jgi:hypothetical protein
MGPQPNALDQVKRDAIRTTLRHFRNEDEENDRPPSFDYAKVEKQLLAEQDAQPTGTPDTTAPAVDNPASNKTEENKESK